MAALTSISNAETTRGTRMLRSAFGPAICRLLDDPDIVEVMLSR